MKKILVIGATGQIGSEALEFFRKKNGKENVIGMDIRTPQGEWQPFEVADAMDKQNLARIIQHYQIDCIFHLVAVLSAVGEKNPDLAWRINIDSLRNVLDLAREYKLQVFWPSSIAAFGLHCPKENTPQIAPLFPQTMYGITKVTGELLCEYYFRAYQVDVRSVRYPGLISYKTPPGGGTTDYAVDIFYQALKSKQYQCFLQPKTTLPMMYMEDGIRAIDELMSAPSSQIKVRTSYNLAAMSFCPEEIVREIQKHIPEFQCQYKPDSRQAIADSWPKSMEDSHAQKDWNWKPRYDLTKMTTEMLQELAKKLK
jgi:nucleoside-diphosphate-sugar epimerase